MGNPFIPFPRNENIIIVGDRATEILAALRIFGQGLIGVKCRRWNYCTRTKSIWSALRVF